MIRLAIVEDEDFFVEQLTQYLDRYQRENGVAFRTSVFRDGEDIAGDYRPEFDIVLLDIQMRFMNGLDAARAIRDRDPEVTLIFITSVKTGAIRGYEVEALDYILKPVEYERFARSLGRAIRRIPQSEAQTVLVSATDGLRKIRAGDVLYVESLRHRMFYHLPGQVLDCAGRMEDIERELAPRGFFRINKGYLVNLNAVDGIQGSCCLIAGDLLPISRARRADFLAALAKAL